MHILVTGGAGFIGSHLVEHHIKKGDKVHVVDDLSSGSIENIMPFMKNNQLIFDNRTNYFLFNLYSHLDLTKIHAYVEFLLESTAALKANKNNEIKRG